MNISDQKIIALKDYFKKQPVQKVYFNTPATQDIVELRIDMEQGRKSGLTFFAMQVDLEDLLGQEVSLVSTGGYAKRINDPRVIDTLIYARTA